MALLLITAARKKKDVQLAAEVLNGALKLFTAKLGSVRHTRAHLWLASSYCAVDVTAGFELMAAAVKAANEAKGLEDVRAEPNLLQLGALRGTPYRSATARATSAPASACSRAATSPALSRWPSSLTTTCSAASPSSRPPPPC